MALAARSACGVGRGRHVDEVRGLGPPGRWRCRPTSSGASRWTRSRTAVRTGVRATRHPGQQRRRRPGAQQRSWTAIPDLWIEDVTVNCISAYLVSRALLPLMIESGGGRVINVGSGMGHRPTAERLRLPRRQGGPVDVHPLPGRGGVAVQHHRERVDTRPGCHAAHRRSHAGGRSPALRGQRGESSEPEDVAPLALFLATQARPPVPPHKASASPAAPSDRLGTSAHGFRAGGGRCRLVSARCGGEQPANFVC